MTKTAATSSAIAGQTIDYTFDEFMKELEDGKFDKKDQVSKLLKEAFSREINLD